MWDISPQVNPKAWMVKAEIGIQDMAQVEGKIEDILLKDTPNFQMKFIEYSFKGILELQILNIFKI